MPAKLKHAPFNSTINDSAFVAALHQRGFHRAPDSAGLAEHRPRAIVNFAAETHVDRSIHGPAAFIQTNVVDTFTLLEATRKHWKSLPAGEKTAFRVLHVSTGEVAAMHGVDLGEPPPSIAPLLKASKARSLDEEGTHRHQLADGEA